MLSNLIRLIKFRNVEGYAESLRAELDVRLPKVLSNIVGEYCLGEGSWQQRISEEGRSESLTQLSVNSR
jgi:hypothetical protein